MLAACGRFDFEQGIIDAPAVGVDVQRMTPVLLDHAEIGLASATSADATLGNVAAGDLIVAAFGYDQTDNAMLAMITDQLGTSYTVLGPDDGGDGNRQYLAYGIATASGTDLVTATTDVASATYTTLRLHEYAHVDRMNPLDVSGKGAANLPAQPTATLTTTDNDVILAFIIVNGGDATAAAGWNAITTGAGDLTEDRNAMAGVQTIDAVADFGKWTLSCAAFRGDF